ncbi:MAG: hypothetical protein P1P87_14825, partial [Trueperaceae bacterium]|nr:hypothetical protein [Trueperaceae bacterium]
MPHRRRSTTLTVALLSGLLALASAAAAAGWSLPGRDDVAEPRPELVRALHAAADAARADAGLAP